MRSLCNGKMKRHIVPEVLSPGNIRKGQLKELTDVKLNLQAQRYFAAPFFFH